MRYASIDVGTNTLRLLIAEAEGNSIRPVAYKRTITRLGGNYTEDGGIDANAAGRTFAALEGFKKIIDEHGASDVMAFATSVVRRARNRDWFIGEVARRTGINITVISGGEEARLSLLGVLSVLEDTGENKLVIDIGGGSTEFIAMEGAEVAGAWSMEMGVVHLTENFLKSDPAADEDLAGLETEIKTVLRDLKGRMVRDGAGPDRFSGNRGAALIGTAGTITTLAAIDQRLEVYDRARINNYRIQKASIEKMYAYMAGLTLKQREEFLSLEKGREDLIIPGTAITLSVMEFFGFDEIKVSDAGLLEGIILDRVLRGGC